MTTTTNNQERTRNFNTPYLEFLSGDTLQLTRDGKPVLNENGEKIFQEYIFDAAFLLRSVDKAQYSDTEIYGKSFSVLAIGRNDTFYTLRFNGDAADEMRNRWNKGELTSRTKVKVAGRLREKEVTKPDGAVIVYHDIYVDRYQIQTRKGPNAAGYAPGRFPLHRAYCFNDKNGNKCEKQMFPLALADAITNVEDCGTYVKFFATMRSSVEMMKALANQTYDSQARYPQSEPIEVRVYNGNRNAALLKLLNSGEVKTVSLTGYFSNDDSYFLAREVSVFAWSENAQAYQAPVEAAPAPEVHEAETPAPVETEEESYTVFDDDDSFEDCDLPF